MAFDPTLATARDRVRFALGDTDDANRLLADATIDAVLVLAGTAPTATVPTPAEAAAVSVLAGALLREFAQKPTSFSESGGISVSWAGRLDAWKALVAGAASAVPGTAGAMVAGFYRLDLVEPPALETVG